MPRIDLDINGNPSPVESPPDRTLLEVLREDLELTGTKYGCGEGACGACTVLVDGEPRFACRLSAEEASGRKITTIEGLSTDGELHPVQEAFLAEKAFQCGYCTPGMILAAVALLEENPDPTEAQILEAMDENLCRCGGYMGIVRAVRRAAGHKQEEVALEK